MRVKLSLLPQASAGRLTCTQVPGRQAVRANVGQAPRTQQREAQHTALGQRTRTVQAHSACSFSTQTLSSPGAFGMVRTY